MFQRSIILVAVAAFAIGTAAIAQNAPAPEKAPVAPSPVKRTIISKIDVPGSNYEVITAILEVTPGFRAGRHLHPGIVSGHILEGEFWLAIDNEPEKTLAAGQSGDIPNRAIHNEGANGTTPVKAVVTYVVEKGQPLVQPVK
jgi:quercetin dioxygenase-like cupin family protein